MPYPVDGAWTVDNAATKQYDSYKVQAVVNWINGHEHSGKGPKVGTPAIYGMNSPNGLDRREARASSRRCSLARTRSKETTPTVRR